MEPIIQPGLYRHFKGTVYQIFGVVQHSETLEWLVLYGEKFPRWTRPVNNFLELVEVKGQYVRRFELVEAY